MYILKSDKTLFCDVDDTLIMWKGHTYSPHLKHIELIKKFHTRGQPVVVWSAGGYEWALKIVKELKLEPYVTAVMAKPMWYVDDLTAPEILPEINRIYLKDDKIEEPNPIGSPLMMSGQLLKCKDHPNTEPYMNIQRFDAFTNRFVLCCEVCNKELK